MSVLPKVYQFIVIYSDESISCPRVVARNKRNAMRWLKAHPVHDQKGAYYTLMQTSWLASIATLLLPVYIYKGNEWTEWSKLK